MTLLTNPGMPAKAFYDRNGYRRSEHVAFLYKRV